MSTKHRSEMLWKLDGISFKWVSLVHYFKTFRDPHPVEIFTEGEDSNY